MNPGDIIVLIKKIKHYNPILILSKSKIFKLSSSMTNIVAIGGGAGTFNVLYGIKKNLNFNITAIISVADNGGTTGAIRDKYGILPPGDMRRAIAALANNTEMVRRLFEYSFK